MKTDPSAGADAAAGRILVVEDDPTARAMLSAWLHTEGFAYEVAGDARAAEAALAAREFDLLICDIQLPDRDGPELVAAIEGENRGVPVVFLTGQPTLETAMRSVRLRVAAYLVKPPNLDELLALVRREVRLQRQRRAVAASRRRVQEWDRELERLEHEIDAVDGPGPVDFLQATVRQLGALLADLDRSVTILASSPETRGALTQLDLVASLRRTVQVLERTRAHFKSKDLGDLRRELEVLLARIGPPPGGPTE